MNIRHENAQTILLSFAMNAEGQYVKALNAIFARPSKRPRKTEFTRYGRRETGNLPFPFSELTGTKRRPVLALTPPDPQGDFIACPVTSMDRWINSSQLLPDHLVAGVLPLPSWVRTDRVVTLHVDLVVKTFCRAAESFRAEIVQDLCHLLREQPSAAGS